MFLFAMFFIISLFSINGKHDKNNSSCLKLALLVCIPLLCVIPSILFKKYSNSLISSEYILI